MPAEFGVHVVYRAKDDVFEVDGRCYLGPITLGTTFHVIKPDTPVHLTVVGIEAYKHSLEEIDEGLTARLRLKGNCADLPEPIFVLSSESAAASEA